MGDKFVYVTYINTTAEKLWEALTKPEFTRQYWVGTVQRCDWQAGSPWHLVFPDGTRADSGEVLEIDPPRRLVLSWRNEFIPEMHADGYSRATFTIEPERGLMKLTVLHEIERTDSAFIRGVSQGWPYILSSLKTLLETGHALPGSDRRPAKRWLKLSQAAFIWAVRRPCEFPAWRKHPMGTLISDSTKYIYFTGLRNAHAMETQAVELLSRQVERLENYPGLEARMREHLEESKIQRTRLEEVLHAHNESWSALKEAFLGLGGNFAAVSHMAAGDEIIKNSLANYMFEHFEIATYTALAVMAETVGDAGGVSAATASRGEEEAMAAWLREHIAPTTLKFLERSAAGQTASH